MNSSSQVLTRGERLNLKLKALLELLKIRLTAVVTFSGAIGYSLAADTVRIPELFLFIIASIAVTGSANTINQIFEKDIDKVMKRTKVRPIPTGRVTIEEAKYWAIFLGIVGISIFVFYFNLRAAAISLLSLIIYGFIYTPLKKVGSVAVIVGAFPGAFPPMIGWVAATNHFGWEPGILFAIQFFWQFPHFWAIAWVSDSEYKKVGYNLLPSEGGKDLNTAAQMMLNAFFLIPISWLPYIFGITGITSAVIATISGVLFLAQTLLLLKKCNDKTALQLMFGSFLYLPIVQIAFLLDKV